jgi:hypothetical protein
MFEVKNFGFRILDFRFWIGFWIEVKVEVEPAWLTKQIEWLH